MEPNGAAEGAIGMAETTLRRRALIRYAHGEAGPAEDDVVTERPVTIVLNGEEFATLVCSPEDVEELAVGYLASEGVLGGPDGLRDLGYDESQGLLYAEVDGVDEWLKDNGSKRYLTSCCGKSRQSYVFYSDARTAKPIAERSVRLTYGQCLEMMARMQARSDLFKATGGVHNAALFGADGELLLARSDIGRHNALDKIYGHCLLRRVPMAGTTLAFSGRVSSEVLLKAAKMRCEVLLSKSAATDLAVELAEELGVTVVGFIRAGSLSVYSHADRIGDG